MDSPHTSSTLEGIAAILSAITWPLVASLLLWVYHKQFSEVIAVLVLKLKSAKSIKAAGIELLAEELIKDAVESAPRDPEQKEVTPAQVESAKRLEQELAGLPIEIANDTIRDQIRRLAHEYDDLRLRYPSGHDRTVRMNFLMSQLRTLALSARTQLPYLVESRVAGERLAAIAILQVTPSRRYTRWLGERFQNESPFVFFHAALALSKLVEFNNNPADDELRETLQNALDRIKSFAGGRPDQNTIAVLEDALKKMSARQSA